MAPWEGLLRFATFAPIALAFCAAPAMAQDGPSFDCAKARTATEGVICAAPELARLDRELDQAYRQRAAADPAPALRAEQRRWLTQRNRCGTAVACLSDTMRRRIAELSADARSVAALPPEPAAASSPTAVAAAPEPPRAVTRPAIARPAVARPGAAGTWTGRYACSSTIGQLTIKLSEGEGDAVEAEMRFTLQNGGSGAYVARGRFNRETGDISLAPVRWIKRPPEVVALGLEGRVNGSGRAIAGRMVGCMFGNSEITLERADPPAAVAQADAPAGAAPPKAGSLEGAWEGNLSCPGRSGLEGSVRLAVLQEGNGLAALVKVTARGQRQEEVSAESVFLGAGADEAALLRLQRSIQVGNRLTGLLPGVLTADPAADWITAEKFPNGCEARLRKVGPAPTPAVPASSAFVGTWVGPDYNVLASMYAGLVEQIRSGGRHGSTSTQLAMVLDGAGLRGEFQASSPAEAPVAQQDRFAVSVRPLFVSEDGMVVLAPLAIRRAEGAFDAASQARGGGSHPYAREPFLLLLAPPKGDKLAVDRAFRTMGREGENLRIVMVRSDPAVAAAIASGDGEPLALPPGYGGAFAKARTEKAQCEVLAAWAQPFTSRPNVERTPMGPEMDREALPLFEDAAFEPVFGLPYPMTTGPQRAPIARLIEFSCARRFGMAQLRHPNVSRPWLAEPLGSFGFAAVTALLMNRADAKAWTGPVAGDIAAMSEDAAGLARLDALERTNRARIEELSVAERAALRTALASKRERIAQAMSRAKMEAALAAPDSAQLVATLATATRELRASKLSAAEQAAMEQRARDKAQAYVMPEIDRANARAADLPATLDGLAEANALLRKLRGTTQALGASLGEADAMRALQPLIARRRALVADPAVQDAFRQVRQVMANLRPSGDPEAYVMQAAAQFLDREELGLPRYAEAIAAAKDLAEARSTEVVDSAPAGEPGEPSATEMAMAVAHTYKNISQNMRNPSGVWAPGPMQQLMTVFSAAMGPMSVRVAYFEKLGCVSAAAAGQPGYNCEMRVQLDTDNRQLAQALPRGVMEARGRFLRSQDGWAFRRQDN